MPGQPGHTWPGVCVRDTDLESVVCRTRGGQGSVSPERGGGGTAPAPVPAWFVSDPIMNSIISCPVIGETEDGLPAMV